MKEVILDVREQDEYEAEHVSHSINTPLSHFAAVAPGVLNQLRESELVILCRSGNRARLALQQLGQMGYQDKINAKIYEGGILEWKRQGKPTIIRRRSHLPLLRQVQLVAGSTVLFSVLMGVGIHSGFLAIAATFGLGLTVAGATGFCGMANILAWMPWNRHVSSTQEELCNISSRAGHC